MRRPIVQVPGPLTVAMRKPAATGFCISCSASRSSTCAGEWRPRYGEGGSCACASSAMVPAASPPTIGATGRLRPKGAGADTQDYIREPRQSSVLKELSGGPHFISRPERAVARGELGIEG
jgi:hypothetical protein